MEKPKENASAHQFTVKTPLYRLESDVILPQNTTLQIQECLAKLKYHRKIYHEWNFKAVDPLGMGTILNFFGPPGTGKTMAAEAFAGTLGLDFIHLGSADVESKFMGETAKNIQSAFKYANETGAELFFDEADTLLGKRLSSVTQGVDNEVNAMRSTLLIELERFEGIAIFATNFAKNYDEAFLSRISHHVQFDLPDRNSRLSMWGRLLVPEIPIEGDRESLISLCADSSDGLSGREIRTAVRLALPKALMRGETTGKAHVITDDILAAVNQIKMAYCGVRQSSNALTSEQSTYKTTKALLGIEGD